MLTIEVDRCDGCGACVEVCPEGAISVVDGVARIDSASCSECEVCVPACPNGAIQVARPVAVREEPTATIAERPRPSTLATLVGATLSFIGSQILPRAADAIVGALDRRLSEKPTAESRTVVPSEGRPGGRRHRRRGGRE